jgi:hypothetical protein
MLEMVSSSWSVAWVGERSWNMHSILAKILDRYLLSSGIASDRGPEDGAPEAPKPDPAPEAEGPADAWEYDWTPERDDVWLWLRALPWLRLGTVEQVWVWLAREWQLVVRPCPRPGPALTLRARADNSHNIPEKSVDTSRT